MSSAPARPASVDLDRPPQLQTREIGEGIPVGDPDPLAAEMLDSDRPSAPGELSHGRVRDEVGSDETVDAEIRIVRLVAEVTAVGPEEAALWSVSASPGRASPTGSHRRWPADSRRGRGTRRVTRSSSPCVGELADQHRSVVEAGLLRPLGPQRTWRIDGYIVVTTSLLSRSDAVGARSRS